MGCRLRGCCKSSRGRSDDDYDDVGLDECDGMSREQDFARGTRLHEPDDMTLTGTSTDRAEREAHDKQ